MKKFSSRTIYNRIIIKILKNYNITLTPIKTESFTYEKVTKMIKNMAHYYLR